MASRRTILVLFTVLVAFVASSRGTTTKDSETTATTTTTTTSPVSSTGLSTTGPASTITPDTATSSATSGVPSTPVAVMTTVSVVMEGFSDLATVDYIIIGVTCGVCAGIIIGAIVIIARKRMRKDKEDASSLVNHGHHPEYITELGGGVTNYKIEH